MENNLHELVSNVCAALDIDAREYLEKGDTKGLNLKILQTIDTMDFSNKCRQKEYRDARKKVKYWRRIAKRSVPSFPPI